MPQRATINQFTGIDRRRLATASDARTLSTARNLDITTAFGVRTRPGTRLIGRVSDASVGLFASGTDLMAVAPAGYPDVAAQIFPGFRYMFVGDGDPQLRGSLEQFHAVEFIANKPYAVVTRAGEVEHHYADVLPANTLSQVATKVTLPFKPDPALVKLASRLWAPSNLTGAVHFSSVVNGPRDWTAIGDAGFLNVIDNAPGDRTIRGFSYIAKKLVVAFSDAMQLWSVDEQPSNITLTDVLNGPGTRFGRTLENVQGDVLYFSRGGFRRLGIATTTGATRETDVGAAVEPVSSAMPTDPEPITLWSQTRGQLLTVFGQTVLVLSYTPSLKLIAWTTWELPFTATDLIEVDGVLYARDQNHYVYRFGDGVGYTSVEWELQTQFLDLGLSGRLKMFLDLTLAQEGRCSVDVLPNRDDPALVLQAAADVDGATGAAWKIPLLQTTEAMALRLSGTGPWRLDAMDIGFQPLGV